MSIPPGLSWLRDEPGGADWLASIPHLVAEVADRWEIQVGDPYPGSNVSWVAPARRQGEAVVLKVQWLHRECEHEAAALSAWSGDGAIELLDHDPERHALLLEHCAPGTHLAHRPDVDAVEVMVSLLPRLWKPGGAPFRTLEDEALGWVESMDEHWIAAGRPCERRLVDAARSFLVDLVPTQGDQVLVHQDLHGDNVLAARREPWLAIDPKPLVGEREFSCAPIVRSFEFGHSERAVCERLDRLSGDLGLDRQRVRGWAVGQTMAWSFSSAYAEQHFETVRWLLDA